MEIRTENLFMDNREDVAFLESEEGAKIIINLQIGRASCRERV